MEIIPEFLKRAKGKNVNVNIKDFLYSGTLDSFDDTHVLLKDESGEMAISINEITDISRDNQIDLIALRCSAMR
jgi:small nuclear ribonucleoprotein (snRNP)-like protein